MVLHLVRVRLLLLVRVGGVYVCGPSLLLCQIWDRIWGGLILAGIGERCHGLVDGLWVPHIKGAPVHKQAD